MGPADPDFKPLLLGPRHVSEETPATWVPPSILVFLSEASNIVEQRQAMSIESWSTKFMSIIKGRLFIMSLGLWWFVGHLELQMWCMSSHSTYYVQVSVLININLYYNYNINLYNNPVRPTPLLSVFYSWRNWSSKGNLPKVTQLPSSKGSVQTGALLLRMCTHKPLIRYFWPKSL